MKIIIIIIIHTYKENNYNIMKKILNNNVSYQ